MSMNYKDFIIMAGLMLASFAVVLAVAAVVYLLIGYGFAYSLALLGLVEFSHSVALGATILTFLLVLMYQYFVEGEDLLKIHLETQ